ncbi:SAM-dependent methyltransferase [Candidatus Atribacteria bacterium HGW-Atribacteria-1]|nr:MAG: SAM-dependent methyltransferase [Candidatus Atribacteria bacterium HGW-Atribacteria-1]
MNKNKLKSYTQNARREFIKAVTQSAAAYGINEKEILPYEEKGDFCFINGKPFPKAVYSQRKALEEHIQAQGFYQVMEDAAYTWFNRFAAIRFMELKGYLSHGYRVLSHPEEKREPEILEKAQYIERLDGLTKEEIIKLKIDGKGEEELYARLLLAQCNELSQVMPFLFEKINDYTELLMPKYLLRNDSLIRTMVKEVLEEDWDSVEIIGWLYQFYISEKKDEVIGSKKAIKTEDIPAATQLFTPNWIVKYLVQNSLGAKWLSTYPSSPIKQEMEYYIEPAEQTPEVVEEIKKMTPATLNPEELTVMDPACGSGHMLVEAYNLLKSIYLERGYRKRDIPKLILEKNLYGLEIDERAAQLSGFALMMKAREDDRQIFEDGIKLNILCLKATKHIDVNDALRSLESLLTGQYSSFPSEKYKFMGVIDGPLFANRTIPEEKKEKSQFILKYIKKLLELFTEADTLGSLIRIPEEIGNNLSSIKKEIESLNISESLMGQGAINIILSILQQAEALYQKYDIVITNPPYMGEKGMNAILKDFAKTQYLYTKSDLFAMFIERGFEMAKVNIGYNAMITQQAWMSLSSYEHLRETMIELTTIMTMVHNGFGAFGADFGTTCFTILNRKVSRHKGTFISLQEKKNIEDKRFLFLSGKNRFIVSEEEFKKIPGSPIAYWVSDRVREVFAFKDTVIDFAVTKHGMSTSDNNKYLRFWHEVSQTNIGYKFKSRDAALNSGLKWFPYNKGGSFRRWYGNNEYLVNWQYNGEEIRKVSNDKYPYLNGNLGFVLGGQEYFFRKGITWSSLTVGKVSMRVFGEGFLFDAKGQCLFPKSEESYCNLIAFLNTKVVDKFLKILSPTIDYNSGKIAILPIVFSEKQVINPNTNKIISYSKIDWDFHETSWDFEKLPILKSDKLENLNSSYQNYRSQCQKMTDEMKQLEEENNHIFIEAYNLQEELTPDVPIKEITLFANPYYRYNGNLTDDELEKRFKADTMKELISYAIGCMMGRYSLDSPGLIYAHSGNVGFDTSQYKNFPADKDGIIPITDTEWFDDDDIVRLIKFIEVVWGKETLEENLNFIAEALQRRPGETSREAVRRYFVNDFYKDHLQTYKKRPIYWLFSSGKEKAFQALVYLHRYNPGTLSRVRTEYVLPLQGSISRHMEHLKKDKEMVSTSAGGKIQKEINKLGKQNEELLSFDEKLKHWADMKIELDLDDGVKVNYSKFGDLLVESNKVTGKSNE